MRKSLLILLLLAPVVAVAQTSHTIVQKNRRFSLAEIAIKRGESLTFTNADEFIHQMYVDGLFDSEERLPGQALTEDFPKTGTFEVRCHIHPKMKLVVRVN